MTFATIETEQQGRVRIIRLNRPEKLNAYTNEMERELSRALREGNADPSVGAFVVTGNGRAFCAGADISGFAATQASGGADGAADEEADGAAVDPAYLAASKPIIGAINGAAVGIGLTWPLLFDVLVASTQARFSMRFAALGLTPELGSTWLLPKVIGLHRAREMMLTGRIYTAAEALELGLVHRLVEPEALLDEAVALAAEIAANPERTLRTIKELIWTGLSGGQDFATLWRMSSETFSASLQTEEAREAVRAFQERRPPKYRS